MRSDVWSLHLAHMRENCDFFHVFSSKIFLPFLLLVPFLLQYIHRLPLSRAERRRVRHAPQGASERERHFPPYSERDAGCSGLRLFRLQNISACKHFSSKISAIILVGPIRDGSFRGKGGTDSGRGGGGSLLWRKSMSSPFSGTRRAGGTVERRYRAALLCLFYAGITEKTAVFSHAFLPDVQFLVSAC